MSSVRALVYTEMESLPFWNSENMYVYLTVYRLLTPLCYLFPSIFFISLMIFQGGGDDVARIQR